MKTKKSNINYILFFQQDHMMWKVSIARNTLTHKETDTNRRKKTHPSAIYANLLPLSWQQVSIQWLSIAQQN